MSRIDIRGAIVPNNDKFIYDAFGMEATSPADVQRGIDMAKGSIDVYVSSPGGEIATGSEIYSMLSQRNDVKIHITGQAHSAASVIAMGGWCEMASTALMMVHCVQTDIMGNHVDAEHAAEVLKTADKALATAYEQKSGMSHEEVIAMMENETWLTAEEAVSLGLVDQVMEPTKQDGSELEMVAGMGVIGREALDRMASFVNECSLSDGGTLYIAKRQPGDEGDDDDEEESEKEEESEEESEEVEVETEEETEETTEETETEETESEEEPDEEPEGESEEEESEEEPDEDEDEDEDEDDEEKRRRRATNKARARLELLRLQRRRV